VIRSGPASTGPPPVPVPPVAPAPALPPDVPPVAPALPPDAVPPVAPAPALPPDVVPPVAPAPPAPVPPVPALPPDPPVPPAPSPLIGAPSRHPSVDTSAAFAPLAASRHDPPARPAEPSVPSSSGERCPGAKPRISVHATAPRATRARKAFRCVGARGGRRSCMGVQARRARAPQRQEEGASFQSRGESSKTKVVRQPAPRATNQLGNGKGPHADTSSPASQCGPIYT
jgi:homeobox protein ESX1